MAERYDLGTAARERMGMESSHLAMAEHPDQGDPLTQQLLQKTVAKAKGHIGPRPQYADALATEQKGHALDHAKVYATEHPEAGLGAGNPYANRMK